MNLTKLVTKGFKYFQFKSNTDHNLKDIIVEKHGKILIIHKFTWTFSHSWTGSLAFTVGGDTAVSSLSPKRGIILIYAGFFTKNCFLFQ